MSESIKPNNIFPQTHTRARAIHVQNSFGCFCVVLFSSRRSARNETILIRNYIDIYTYIFESNVYFKGMKKSFVQRNDMNYENVTMRLARLSNPVDQHKLLLIIHLYLNYCYLMVMTMSLWPTRKDVSLHNKHKRRHKCIRIKCRRQESI